MNTTQFSGVHTALITPFKQDAIAWDDLAALIEDQVNANISGLVAVGTTGESPTLDQQEHLKVVGFTVEKTDGRVPVIAGTGANSTREAVHLTRSADKLGADAFLQVAPYYNKPSPEGLYRHFCAIADVTEKPIILYSIPGRCGIEIGVEVVQRLHESHPHVIGIKEAGGRSDRVLELRQAMPDDFLILSGDDALTLPFIACGAKGVISVASNIIPGEMVKMTRLALKNDMTEAAAINEKWQSLFSAMLSLGPNPVPVKQAMAILGKIKSPEVRLPLCELTDAQVAHLREILGQSGLV